MGVPKGTVTSPLAMASLTLQDTSYTEQISNDEETAFSFLYVFTLRKIASDFTHNFLSTGMVVNWNSPNQIPQRYFLHYWFVEHKQRPHLQCQGIINCSVLYIWLQLLHFSIHILLSTSPYLILLCEGPIISSDSLVLQLEPFHYTCPVIGWCFPSKSNIAILRQTEVENICLGWSECTVLLECVWLQSSHLDKAQSSDHLWSGRVQPTICPMIQLEVLLLILAGKTVLCDVFLL